MQLQEKKQIAKDAYEFTFTPDVKLNFRAGQYLEWSLPHAKEDMRGIRRYFTIASSPQDALVKLGIRVSEPSSSFKQKLQALTVGETMYAGSLDGDFVLPKDKKHALVFLAGGIGITPFISMVRDLMDANTKVDIVLFYANKTDDIAYMDVLKEAEKKIGLKTVYVLDASENFSEGVVEKGPLTQEVIKKYVPNIANSMVYLSGPNAMVDAYKKLVKQMGVSWFNIKTDYFPGF